LEGGSLEVLCFDKTGTLTHDHMDFRAFVPLGEGRFEETIGAADIKRIP
jgi:P-type E1-E2 ATPase